MDKYSALFIQILWGLENIMEEGIERMQETEDREEPWSAVLFCESTWIMSVNSCE